MNWGCPVDPKEYRGPLRQPDAKKNGLAHGRRGPENVA